MYVKLYSTVFTGSLRGKSNTLFVWICMLTGADRNGVFDKTHQVICDDTGLSMDSVKEAINELESPDPNSRSPELEGRRITRIDEHRTWGWNIVNYAKYRDMKNEEARRDYFAEAQRRHRAKKTGVSESKGSSTTVGGGVEVKQETDSCEILSQSEKVYLEYPRKVGKPAALAKIKKAIIEFGFEFVIEKTKLYSKTYNGDPAYIPYPAKWFNQQQFNDDPSTWAKTPNANNGQPSQRINRNIGTLNENIPTGQYRQLVKVAGT